MSYTIAQDTICQGWQCVIFYDGEPATFATEAEAEAEMATDDEFYDDECFVCHVSELGRKAIYHGGSSCVANTNS